MSPAPGKRPSNKRLSSRINKPDAQIFPEGFLWGAASSPTQVEGETVNEWADTLAKDNFHPDNGPSQWRRYRFDFKTMSGMGVKAYRFGFDWGRLQKAPGEPFDRDTILRYLEMLAELRSFGITPWLTLFHHALPRWAAQIGGWLNPKLPGLYAEYAQRIADITDGEVLHWITIHEPAIYAFSAYAWGLFPPRHRSRFDQVRQALLNMAEGHRLAAEKIKARLPASKVGLAIRTAGAVPTRTWHPGDRLAAWASRWGLENWGTWRFIKEHCDFLALRVSPDRPVRASLSIAGGLKPHTVTREVETFDTYLERVNRMTRMARLPVYVYDSPNGGDDEAKCKGLAARLAACHRAIAKGMDVRGFFHDPFLDCFDWVDGLSRPHGLLRVDFSGKDRRREHTPASRMFSQIAKTNQIAGD